MKEIPYMFDLKLSENMEKYTKEKKILKAVARLLTI